MVCGQKNTYRILREKIDPNEKYIWVHCASLGEFEQARPMIETLKKEYPAYRILLTFFSPSGYEVRKEYAFADIVCYLPFDTPKRVNAFSIWLNQRWPFSLNMNFGIITFMKLICERFRSI